MEGRPIYVSPLEKSGIGADLNCLAHPIEFNSTDEDTDKSSRRLQQELRNRLYELQNSDIFGINKEPALGGLSSKVEESGN